MSSLAVKVLADTINMADPQVFGEEGRNVTLSCSYLTTYKSVYYLYWYRHYPGTPPQYILHKANQGSLSNTAPFADGKFSCEVTTNSTHLYMNDVKTEDSARYVCALQAAQCDTDQLRSDINLTLTTVPGIGKTSEGDQTLLYLGEYSKSISTLDWAFSGVVMVAVICFQYQFTLSFIIILISESGKRNSRQKFSFVPSMI